MRRILLALGLTGCASSPDLAAGGGEMAPAASPEARCLEAASAAYAPLADAPSRITVAHVLVKHRDADRAPPEIDRSRGQACLRALEALEALKAGGEIDEVAARFSDEEGAASRGGMIGEIAREDVAPSFGDAAFRLDISEVSHVVESPFGFHVILRTR